MWLTIFVTACAGLGDYLPEGPVLSARDMQEFASPSASEPALFGDTPVLPLQIFGVRYERDLVLETNHPQVTMLEVASLEIPGQEEIWIAKIADEEGTQSLVSHREEILSWMPEVDAPRSHQPTSFSVSEEASGRLEVNLLLPSGEALEAVAKLKPLKRPRRTNSSTFNHSQHIALAILEVSGKRIGLQASLAISGKPQSFRRVFGLIPVKALLEQTQGGVVTADIEVSRSGDSLELLRPESWSVPGLQICAIARQEVVCPGSLGSTHYRFIRDGFSAAEVIGPRGERRFMLQLDEPLPPITPDLEGEHRRKFAVNIGGIQGAGHGVLVLRGASDGESIHLGLYPEAPRWFAARPMESLIDFHPDGGYRLQTHRIQEGH